MKRNRLIAAMTLFLGVVLVLGACHHCVDANGPVKKKKRSLTSFEKLSLETNAEMIVKLGDTNLMIVEAPENIIPVIKSDISRGTLHVSSDCFKSDKAVRITLTVKKLEAISLSGSGRVKVMQTLSPKKFKVSLNGSGQVEVDVLSPETDAEVSGSGTLIINGTTNEFDVDMSGSGKVRALGLRSKEVYADLSGSGEIFVVAGELLKASVAGSGVINYSGSPKVRTKIDGTGKVVKIN